MHLLEQMLEKSLGPGVVPAIFFPQKLYVLSRSPVSQSPAPPPPQCDDPVHTTHCSNDYNMAASLLLWRWVGRNIGTPLHAVTKSPTPSNLIGSMMILRVLPIHVPPCYEGGYLKPTPLKPYMTYDDHHSTSIIRRQCKDKGHSSHPQEKPQSTSTGGDGASTLHWAGWGGLPKLDHMEYLFMP